MGTITAAASQYANRPQDERFPSVGAMLDHARHEKNLSRERNYPFADLTVKADGPELTLNSAAGTARFSHWGFGQLARIVGAPAGYLRDNLSPALAAQCLNEGMRAKGNEQAKILVRAANGTPYPIVRALTTDTYARVWDADLYGAIVDQLQSKDDRWTLPPTWDGKPAGAYRGDRDSFLILCNGGSIVTDPSAGGGFAGLHNGHDVPRSAMFRALLVRNSEVGASSIVIEQILYRFVCGNHNLWGAIVDQSFSRRHVGKTLNRDTMSEISRIAYSWANRSAGRDEAIVQSLIDHRVATTAEDVIAKLRSWGATEDQAISAIATCKETESADPLSYWGLAQGFTRDSQTAAYQDARYQLDKLAGLVLQRGARLVAA